MIKKEEERGKREVTEGARDSKAVMRLDYNCIDGVAWERQRKVKKKQAEKRTKH